MTPLSLTTRSAPRRAAAALVAGCLLAAGCAHPPAPHRIGDGFMEPESAVHASDSAWLAQVAEGARQDGMLYERHFDGATLNELGQNKIVLAAQANGHGRPLALRMIAEDTDARRASVRDFMSVAGVPEGGWTLDAGPGDAALSPAIAGLAAEERLRNTDRAADGAAAASANGSFAPTHR